MDIPFTMPSAQTIMTCLQVQNPTPNDTHSKCADLTISSVRCWRHRHRFGSWRWRAVVLSVPFDLSILRTAGVS